MTTLPLRSQAAERPRTSLEPPADSSPPANDQYGRRVPAALSDAELIAALIQGRFSSPSKRAMAEALLRQFGGMSPLLTAAEHGELPINTLKAAPGLRSALELARRAMGEQLQRRYVFSSPDAVKRFLQLHLARLDHEVFAVIFLDAQNRMIEFDKMFRGTLTQTSVYPREILAKALGVKAAAVVLAHNHPSGAVQPSRADEMLTQTIKAALALVDVRVLDHVIVAPGQALSMAERGLF